MYLGSRETRAMVSNPICGSTKNLESEAQQNARTRKGLSSKHNRYHIVEQGVLDWAWKGIKSFRRNTSQMNNTRLDMHLELIYSEFDHLHYDVLHGLKSIY